MTRTAVRYLYLARHAEASPDDGRLTEAGRRQAVLLGERLCRTPLSAVVHGPLPRAEETARLVQGRLRGVELKSSEAAGDYVPHVPERDELPAESADFLLDRLAELPAGEREGGREQAEQALAAFAGPAEGGAPRHELVVTHAFLIGWLVRDALDAPEWRWMGLNHANAGLTVIRYTPGRPASLLLFNDTGHLPPRLRRTGQPREIDV
ncbi:phosphoglycerate mutase [Streptomyces nanshensis]|nr:phosphoglycerate mutase [Streptomyces nanshensis]